MALHFRPALIADITSLVELMNQAYRQQKGRSWTSEVDIVKGDRISQSQLENALIQDNFKLFVAERSGKLVACIGLTFDHEQVEVGTFAVLPEVQNQSLGREVLDFAENYAANLNLSHLKYFVMWVLSVRYELIAYYERRGYVQTGVVEDYPVDESVGVPIVDLHLVEMRKPIGGYFSSDINPYKNA